MVTQLVLVLLAVAVALYFYPNMLQKNAATAPAKTAASKATAKQATAPGTPSAESVTVTIDGVQYGVLVKGGRDDDSIIQSCTDFCISNAGTFDLTDATIQGSCIMPIAQYIKETWVANGLIPTETAPAPADAAAADNAAAAIEEASAAAAQAPFAATVNVNIGGTDYRVGVRGADDASIVQAATDFCVSNHVQFGLTNENIQDGCVMPVARHIHAELTAPVATDAAAAATAAVPETPAAPAETAFSADVKVNIGGTEFSVNVRGQDDNSIVQSATNFCVSNAAQFGLTNENAQQNCVLPVAKHIKATLAAAEAKKAQAAAEAQAATEVQAQQPAGSGAVVAINIGGTRLEIAVNGRDDTSIVKAATDFCVMHHEALKLTNENVQEKCILPVAKHIKVNLMTQEADAAATAAAAATPVAATEEAAVETAAPAAAAVPETETPAAPVIPNLYIVLEGAKEEDNWELNLRINDNNHLVSFNPQHLGKAQVAEQFCHFYKDILGIATEEVIREVCIPQMIPFIGDALEKKMAEMQQGQAAESA